MGGRDLRSHFPTAKRSYMRCPTCPDQTLTMSERKGIEIDYCPACRGVWLDRGELDKIIERATAEIASVPSMPAAPTPAVPAPGSTQAAPPQYPPPPPYQPSQPQYRPSYEEQKYGEQKYGEKKRKKNFFEELFD